MRRFAVFLLATAFVATPAAAQDHYLFSVTQDELAPRATLTFDGITPYVAVDTGWIRNDGRHSQPAVNYITGSYDGDEYNSFFNFNIGALAPVSPYTSAVLTLKAGISGGTPPFDLTLFDVDADYLTLDQERPSGNATGQALFADLGSGTSYGFLSVGSSTTLGETVTIDLNQTFIDQVNAGLLLNFSIGGTLSPTNAAAVPEPSTWAMMLLGFGLAGGAMRASRRKPKLDIAYS